MSSEIIGVFTDLGMMFFVLMLTYFVYQFCRFIKPIADKEVKYELYEELILEKVSKKKGIDLEKEQFKRDVFKRKRPTMRRRLEDEIYTEMFGKEKE